MALSWDNPCGVDEYGGGLPENVVKFIDITVRKVFTPMPRRTVTFERQHILTAKTQQFFRVMWFLIRRQHSCQLQPYMNMNSLIATHPDLDYSAQFAEEQKKPKKCLLNKLEFLIYLRNPNIDLVYIFVTFFRSLLRSNFICFTSDCKSILRN